MDRETLKLTMDAFAPGRLVVAAAVLATGCASTGGPAEQAPALVAELDAELRRNFTAEEQAPHMDRVRVVRGDRPFRGDCDDFAFAAAYRLGEAGVPATVVVVEQRYRSEPHSLTCGAGWCLDSYAARAYPERELRSRYLREARRVPLAPGSMTLTEDAR